MPLVLPHPFRWFASHFRTGTVPYEPLAVTFPPVDVLRYRNQLHLDLEGSQHGSHNSPTSDYATFDEIEKQIVNSIESERNKAQEIYISNARVYGDRLRALQTHTLLQRAAGAADEARAEFSDTSSSGKDRLFELEKTLQERARELERFKTENGLGRPSNRPESRVLHIGIVAVLLLIEAALNGLFLARGLEHGPMQGVAYAAVIAALNVGSGLVLGAFFLRQLHHRQTIRKLVGTIGIVTYGCLAVALNFAVAHYRDALGGSNPENAAVLAWQSLKAAPLHLDAIDSLLLLVMGISFSFFATVDGYEMDDPYPGYGRLVADYRREQDDFRETKEEEAGALAQLKDNILKRLDRHTSDIESRRATHYAVAQRRSGFNQLFLHHLDHLEQAGNELLANYRNANSRTRSTPAPAHFSQPWKMPRPDISVIAIEDRGTSFFPDVEAAKILGQLEATRRDILKSYSQAQVQYASIANVVKGSADHVTAASSEAVRSL